MIVGAYVMGFSLKAIWPTSSAKNWNRSCLLGGRATGMSMRMLRLLGSRSIIVFGAVYTLVAVAASVPAARRAGLPV